MFTYTWTKFKSFFLTFKTISSPTFLAHVCFYFLYVDCWGFAFWAITETIIDITFMRYTNSFLTKLTPITLILHSRIIFRYRCKTMTLRTPYFIFPSNNISLPQKFIHPSRRNIWCIYLNIYQTFMTIIEIIPVQAIYLWVSFITFTAFDFSYE